MTVLSDNVTELPSDTSTQDSSPVLYAGDSVEISEVDNLTSSHDMSATDFDTVAASNITVTASSPADVAVSFQNKLQESDSTDLSGIRRRPAGQSSKTSENATVSGSTVMSGDPTVSTGQTVSVQEYCQAFEQWTLQYYLWMQHMHWMTWAAYMTTPMVSCIPSTGSTRVQSPLANAMPHVPPIRFQQQPVPQQPVPHARGRECRIPSLSRRVTAEFVDFLLVFSIKLVASIVAVEYGFDLFRSVPVADVETLLTMNWDPNIALSITSELVVMEVINRIFICIFESISLSMVGATPGKRLLGIRVVACNELADLPGGRIRILPAGNISLGNAIVRSVIKNFSLAFFFPVCLTVFFFTHNRTGYDIISGSIVVEFPEDNIWAARPQ